MLCAETVFCTWFDNDAVASYQMELDEWKKKPLCTFDDKDKEQKRRKK